MISMFPRRGYYRPLETLTHYELYRYALRGPEEAREVEQVLERRRAMQAELESMTLDDLSAYAKRGRTEDILAAAEKLRRWRRSEQAQSNVVEFRQPGSNSGGVA